MSMGIIAVAGAVITGGIALYNGAKNRELAEGMANDAATLQRQQQAKKATEIISSPKS